MAMHDTDTAPPSQRPDQASESSRTLVCTANFLSFEPGLYAVEFRADADIRSDVGLSIPCARLEPVTVPGSSARASIVSDAGDAWLTRQAASASLLVVGERLGAVLTVYQYSDQSPAPEVQFHQVYAARAHRQDAGDRVQPAMPRLASAPPQGNASPGGILLTVRHAGGAVQSRADGDWVGGSDAIEGFSISVPDGLPACDLEYQAILGISWRTPWFPAGTFCGSQGMGLPLLGFCLRIAGSSADQFECRSWGRFGAGVLVGPIEGGQDCACGSEALTGMKVQVSLKAGSPTIAAITVP
jgi:hypothetical protein